MNEHPLIDDGEYIAYFPELGKTLGSVERAVVLQYLWYRRDRTTGRATLTYDELADETGISTRTVRRVTDWLIENFHLVKHRAGTWDSTSAWEVRWKGRPGQSGQVEMAEVDTSHLANLATSHLAKMATPSSKNPEELKSEGARSSDRKRTTTGTRLPEGWTPDDELKAWTIKEFPGLDGRSTAAKFRDYYAAAIGSKGVSADWSATWRLWCRREVEGFSPAAASTGTNRAQAERPGTGIWAKTVTDPYGLEGQTPLPELPPGVPNNAQSWPPPIDTRPGASSWNRKLVPCATCGGKHPEGAICE